MRYKKLLITMLMISFIGLSSDIDEALVKKDEQDKKRVVREIKLVNEKPTEVINSNTKLYGSSIEILKEDLLKKIRKSNKNVTMDIVNLAFKSANNREHIDDITIEEHFRLVALHLAVMEVESNFDNSVIGYNSTTTDYGIMQVNSSVIKYIKDNLNNQSLDVYNIEDNIEMGSFEIYECYSKAKQKHPDNIIWWTYAYYNRGLYFENYAWDYDQTNKRSKKFIRKYNKYFKILYNK